jgi:hypothetical protein
MMPTRIHRWLMLRKWRPILEKYGAIEQVCQNCHNKVPAYPDGHTLCILCGGRIPAKIEHIPKPPMVLQKAGHTIVVFPKFNLRPRETVRLGGRFTLEA